MNIRSSGTGFLVTGLAPIDPAFTRQARRAFWQKAADVVLGVKRESLRRGLDKMGRPMQPISSLTAQARDDDINSVTGRHPYSPRGRANSKNAPLQATGKLSRTQRLLEAQVQGNGLYVTWRRDPSTGRPWGEILARHARGFFQWFRYPRAGGGYVPARDVIGLSADDQREIKRRMDLWWKHERPKYAPAKPTPEPLPLPEPSSRPNRSTRYNLSDVVYSTIQVIGHGHGGGTYGPGTVVSAKLINRGMILPPLPPLSPRGPKPGPGSQPPTAPAAPVRPRSPAPAPLAARAQPAQPGQETPRVVAQSVTSPAPAVRPAPAVSARRTSTAAPVPAVPLPPAPRIPRPVTALRPQEVTTFLGLKLQDRIPDRLRQSLPKDLAWITQYQDFTRDQAALEWWMQIGAGLNFQIIWGWI